MSLNILDNINDAIISNHDTTEGFRNHYGVSQIGKSCKRASWYDYHWITIKEHSARILRIFDRGHREEPALIKLLRAAGYKVLETNPETGEQFRFSDKQFSVIAGSVDGILVDLTADGSLVGLEIKTMKASKFRELSKSNCHTAQPVHFSQMQGYMALSQGTEWELNAFLYIPINKDDDSIYSELIPYDAEFAHVELEIARDVVRANEPPDRISSTEDWYECKWCDHKAVCFRDALPTARNCRSCRSSRPNLQDAKDWKCLRFDLTLDRSEQLLGCNFYEPREG